MKKITLALISICLFFSFQAAEAKLLIYSPQETIDSSDLIFMGTVAKKEYFESSAAATISVDKILKGETADNEIVLKYRDMVRNKPVAKSWFPFIVPDEGTKIMLLLRKGESDEYRPTADANSIAVLEDGGNVKLHQVKIGQWTQVDYERAYQALLIAAWLEWFN
jgi:hypothetical protein